MLNDIVTPMPLRDQPPPMTAGEKDMRRDPAFPDAEPDLSVFDGLMAELEAWEERALKLRGNNQQLLNSEPGRGAFHAFRKLEWHVSEARMAASCCHEFPYGGNCDRLACYDLDLDGHYCAQHIDSARERAKR